MGGVLLGGRRRLIRRFRFGLRDRIVILGLRAFLCAQVRNETRHNQDIAPPMATKWTTELHTELPFLRDVNLDEPFSEPVQ